MPGIATSSGGSVLQLHVGRGEVELRGVHDPVPAQGAAGVGAHPAHDRGEAALRDLPPLVEGLARLDARDEVGVLHDVGVRRGLRVLPGLLSLDVAVGAVREGEAGGADHALRDVLRGPRGLPAHAHDARAVRVLVLDGEVVVDVAEHGVGSRGAAAHARALDGVGAEGPVHDVEVVDVLLDDVVARGPAREEPVADLPLHVRPALGGPVGPVLRGTLDPQGAHVPVALPGHQLADVAGVHALHDLEVVGLVAALGAGHDGEALLRRELRGGDDGADAERVDRHRLLREDVLAGLDRGLEVLGAEEGRGGEDHHVDVRGQDLLPGVEAGEAGLGSGGEPGGGELLLQLPQRPLELVGEHVAEGGDHDVGGGGGAVDGRAGAAPAAADDPDPDLLGHPGGEEAPRERGGERGERRRAQDVPAGEGGRPDPCFVFHGSSLLSWWTARPAITLRRDASAAGRG